MMVRENEAARLRALRELNLLDTPPSESFNRITRMASQLFNAPIAAVSLSDHDRQWFKSRVGCPLPQLPREQAPCAEVTRASELLVVPDLDSDPRFACSPSRQMGARFYAGAPLITADGYCLGAMCVLDTKPREVTTEEIKLLEDLAAMVMAQIELQHALGRIDPVSHLPNRNQFREDLEDLARDFEGEARVAVLVDLADGFQRKELLRVLGYGFFEDLVKSARGEIEAVLGGQARLYHVGLTAFLFLLANLGERKLQAKIAEIHTRLRTVTLSTGVPALTDVAIGISSFRLGEMKPLDAVRTAYAAAQDARDADLKIGTYDPSRDEEHQRRFTLLAALRDALEEGDQLSLVYQPRVDIRSGACRSAEALLRWNHPVLGSVSPAEFIPLVEQTALARPVTAWVVDAAFRQVAAWRATGIALRVSINISATNFEEDDFAERLGEALRLHGLEGADIELEFTESALIRNRARVLEQLEAVRAMGFSTAIDDFGTGYSSFSYLQDIPADVVKIDRSFMRAMAGEERGRTLVQTMIAMAHDLGYTAVAEGVETPEMEQILTQAGCDELQGYLISRPVSPTALARWLERGAWAPLRAA